MSHPYSGEYHEDLQMEGGKVKHTAGPWVVDIQKDGGNWDYQIRDNNGKNIATVNKYLNPDANAHLIASAPELLEACKRALPWMGKLIASRVHEDCVMPNDAVRTMEMLEAYIAKAEGRA